VFRVVRDITFGFVSIKFYLAKSKRASNQMVMDDDAESDDEIETSQIRSDDDEFRN
jgi:hypothetical protein